MSQVLNSILLSIYCSKCSALSETLHLPQQIIEIAQEKKIYHAPPDPFHACTVIPLPCAC